MVFYSHSSLQTNNCLDLISFEELIIDKGYCACVCVCYDQKRPSRNSNSTRKIGMCKSFLQPFIVFHSYSTFWNHIFLGLSRSGELIIDKC